jgi:hypothetical protein
MYAQAMRVALHALRVAVLPYLMTWACMPTTQSHNSRAPEPGPVQAVQVGACCVGSHKLGSDRQHVQSWMMLLLATSLHGVGVGA